MRFQTMYIGWTEFYSTNLSGMMFPWGVLTETDGESTGDPKEAI